MSRVSPPTNKAQLHYSPPKAKPKIFTAQPPPTQLKFTTHNFQKKITGTASLFPPLPKHRRALRKRATQTLFAAATILPILACKNMVQLTKDRGKKQRHSNLCI